MNGLHIKAHVIVVAGGSGTRYDSVPKQFTRLPDGRMIVQLPLATYDSHPDISEITLVHGSGTEAEAAEAVEGLQKVKHLVKGGRTRQESVSLGLETVRSEFVLIHDAARPLVYTPAVEDVLRKLQDGAELVNTVLATTTGMVALDNDGLMTGSIDRGKMAQGQCPQGFRTEILRFAHEDAAKEPRTTYGDDCSMVLAMPWAPRRAYVVGGHPMGFKLTYPEDIDLLLYYLRKEEWKKEPNR
jgi:2-C-methyl-D-erythritol 4-phosphate cytidylyltransferase